MPEINYAQAQADGHEIPHPGRLSGSAFKDGLHCELGRRPDESTYSAEHCAHSRRKADVFKLYIGVGPANAAHDRKVHCDDSHVCKEH